MHYDILVKRKSILCQIRKRLSTLGGLDEMEHNLTLFQECFVQQRDLNGHLFLKYLKSDDNQDEKEERVYHMLQELLRNSAEDVAKAFLKFVTGSCSYYLARRISVSCHSSNSILASACWLNRNSLSNLNVILLSV